MTLKEDIVALAVFSILGIFVLSPMGWIPTVVLLALAFVLGGWWIDPEEDQ